MTANYQSKNQQGRTTTGATKTGNEIISVVKKLEKKTEQKTQCFTSSKRFELECGEHFNSLTLSYSTYGKLNQDKSNVVWVCHALTADANPLDWWKGLVGDNDLFNADEHFIVCANVIGSSYGSTSPLNCDADKRFDAFPQVSIRDNIHAFIELRKHLGLDKIHTLIGGSMGGQQALEWAIIESEAIEHLILLATSAVLSPWATAFNQSQRLALLADKSWGKKSADAAQKGLKAARSIALLSYRNSQAYNQTQQDEFDFHRTNKAVSYQNYQGEKLVSRFNAYSYYAMTETMDTHDVGRKRGGIKKALATIQAQTLVIGIDSDYLFTLEDSRLLADSIAGAKLEVISSDFGHDGFLIEHEKISAVIEDFYSESAQNNASVGLFGLGCVGQGFYQLSQQCIETAQIKSVAVKHNFKARKFASDKITTQQDRVLNDRQIDTIVETINDDEIAYTIAKSTVTKGKKFVSASKKMIAKHLPEIIAWNKTYQNSFLYEAAVAGSLPIIRNLDLYFDQAKNQRIQAIINGSSNYILTQMFHNNSTYSQALQQAQNLGFAETDPLADVGGFDAKYKAIIIAAHAFGFVVHPDCVVNFGLQNITANDLDFAKNLKSSIKQVATLSKTDQGVSITIMPELVASDSELAKTDDENNLIILTNNNTEFYFKGAGAGSIATGTAVVADLQASKDNYCYHYKIKEHLKLDSELPLKVRINKKDFKPCYGTIYQQSEHHCMLLTSYAKIADLAKKQAFVVRIP